MNAPFALAPLALAPFVIAPFVALVAAMPAAVPAVIGESRP
jgi:hypothetical protein